MESSPGIKAQPLAVAGLLPASILAVMMLGCKPIAEAPQHEHSRINGSVPPGLVTAAEKTQLLAKSRDADGRVLLVYKTIRVPGTRAPIHYHDHGGVTCVLEGQSTMRIEGRAAVNYKAGDCFEMPPRVPMANLSSGKGSFVTLDIFAVPDGAPVWRVVEPGQQGISSQFN